jgi:predicted dehydrogenase
MIVYNDVSLDQKLVIYDKGVSNPDELRCHKTVLPHKTYDDFRIELRDGDITIPHMKVREPLREECIQFIRSIETKQKPLSDGNNGLDVVRILNACSLSMSEDGTRKSVV